MFSEFNAASTSVERTLGSTGGTKYRHIIFIIIESGMTLFVIQLVHMVLEVIVGPGQIATRGPRFFANDYLISINEMFNVIIRSINFYF